MTPSPTFRSGLQQRKTKRFGVMQGTEVILQPPEVMQIQSIALFQSYVSAVILDPGSIKEKCTDADTIAFLFLRSTAHD